MYLGITIMILRDFYVVISSFIDNVLKLLPLCKTFTEYVCMYVCRSLTAWSLIASVTEMCDPGYVYVCIIVCIVIHYIKAGITGHGDPA